MRSLRTRLALISTLVSGVAIVGVSLLAWYYMVQAVRDSIDLRLEGISGRLIRDLHPRVDWARMRERIRITHGAEIEEGMLALQIRDDLEGMEIFSSIDDPSTFRGFFPDGFPTVPPAPKDRTEWKDERSKEPPQFGKKGRPGKKAGDLSDEEWLRRELNSLLGPDTDPVPGDGAGLDPGPGPGGEEAGPDWVAISNDPFASSLGNSEFATVVAPDKDWRVIVAQERGYYVMVALDLTQSIADLKRLERGFLVGIPLALVLIGFGGWFVAERAMRPIRNIAETASHITTRELSARIENDSHTDPEIEHLTEVLNDMMNRLEKGFSHATRFSADVSHELKTPITVMQAEIETGLRNCEPGTSEEGRLLILRGETDRLKSITRSLMLLSQADVGELIRRSDPIDLSAELISLSEDAEILAEGVEVTIDAQIEDGIQLEGDATLFRQALLNLVNNAIKYNEPGGYVTIEAQRESDSILIAVENSGKGIAREDREKIFDRFYRADRARSRGVDGFGLGLSLAEAVVEGHGGELRLARADDEATRFEVLIPMAGEE